MKRLPIKAAKRLAWGLIAGIIVAALAFAVVPSAKAVLGIVLIVLFAAALAVLLVCLRCPECGAQLRLEDKFCSQCGAKLEE